MATLKTKAMRDIEQKMENLDEGSLRYHILQSARDFKTSWIDLGRALYTVWKDKMYKEWGYGKFEAYTSREIGVRKQTAIKLLRSYFFLEKEEPEYLKGYLESEEASSLPTYESIDVLRMAKNKKILDTSDYASIKKEVLEKGRDAGEVRKELTGLIRQRQELEPEEAWQNKKVAVVRRFLSTLKSLKEEIEIAKLLPAPLIKEAAALIQKLESEIN